MASITDIDGLSAQHVDRLRSIGIRTSDDLLGYGANKRGRKKLSQVTRIGDKRVLEWIKRADLLRVPGIHVRYSDLLDAAGIESVKDLRRRNPRKLHAELNELNEQRSLVTRLPNEDQVGEWVSAAKSLPNVLKG